MLAAALTAASGTRADESFDVSAYAKKPFELSGYAELRPEYQWLREDSVGYLLQYPGQQRSSVARLLSTIQLAGAARYEALSFQFSGQAAGLNQTGSFDSDSVLYEGYGAWQIDTNSRVEVGKRALLWGKGYAWNPVGFLQRPKDPLDPEQQRQGYVMAIGSSVHSFDGPLRTVALTGVVVPTTGDSNSDFGAPGHLNPAVKVYGLLYDTDIDLIYTGRGSQGPRFGVDFSRNLGSALEVHGEWAHVTDATRMTLNANHRPLKETQTYDSWLIGLRYLTENQTTVIAELYKNGGGYTEQQLSDFFSFARQFAQVPLFADAVRAAAQGYLRPNPMRRYAYLRVSQNEPFDILYLTPSITLIVNTEDRSYSLVQDTLYTGVKNLELRLRLAFTQGESSTEYGEKAVGARVEVRARLFF